MKTLLGIFLLLVCTQAYAQGPPTRHNLNDFEIRDVDSGIEGQYCVIITTPYPDGIMTFFTEHGGEVALTHYDGAEKRIDGRYDHWYCFPINLWYDEASKKLMLVKAEIKQYAYLSHFEPRALREY